jgi:protein involved in polysaccharide export with SLBB domain
LYLILISFSFPYGEDQKLLAEDGGNFTTAIDPDQYIIGPGDKFRIDFWDGSTEVINLTVTPEGTVLLKSMGLLSVSNLTLTKAREKLLNLIGQFASQRVSEMLDLAKGLRPGACRRDIRLSDGNRVRIADLLLFERTGSLTANPYIFSGNNIEVPFIRDSSVFVQISGEVFLPGGLEYSKNDNLGTIINLAMGFSGLESDSIIIYRKGKEADSYRQLTVEKSRLDFPVMAGDKIIIPRRDTDITADYFSIAGEVIQPGRYPYRRGMDLNQAVAEGRGLTDKADINSLAIFRKQKDNLPAGELRAPEETNPNFLSLTGESAPVAIAVDLLERDKFNLIDIFPGDSIIFPPLTGLVGVFGMVNIPGIIKFREGLSANDCIKLAGGYSPGAEKKSIRLVRKSTGANIVVDPGARIFDGDRIIVVEKKDKKDLWDKIKDISLILGGIGIVYLAVDNMTE